MRELTIAEPPRSRRRMTSEERREQLIDVAREVFAERGYGDTAIEEIAARADVSKPIVYQHFGEKERLYVVVVDREVNRLLDRIKGSLEATTPRAALEQTAKAFLSYIEDEPDGFRVLVRDGPSGKERGRLPSVLADVATAVEDLLARELRVRGLPRKMAPVLARALVGMVAMTGEWWLDARRPSKDAVAADLVNLAWNGLKDLDSEPKLGLTAAE